MYVMLKPAGSRCNMACQYCYYKQKGNGMLSEQLLEEFTRQYLQAQTVQQVLFIWHGGEPLLMPIGYYRKALEMQRRYANGLHIDNCIQTNGMLLSDEWCEFLHDNHFLVGISIDGPQHMHDAYRHNGAGHASWTDVMRAIHLLQRHQVEWNAMATVNHISAQQPLSFYRFFRDIGCQYLQFTPVVERLDEHSSLMAGSDEGGTLAPYSVTPEQWGTFLCAVYDEWVRRDVGTIFVQTFDATLANWIGEAPGVCSLSASCGSAAVMEADGTLYSCDHFVFPHYRLGNIRQHTLTEMLYGEQMMQFSKMKQSALPRQCRECPFLFACHGECPRCRFMRDRYGDYGLNYLCSGYKKFFQHVSADMDYMKKELMAGRAPANIMARY